MSKIVFLFPAFQPTDLLPNVLSRLRGQDESVIVVVDDGSDAGQLPFFEAIRKIENTTVLTNAVNLGKGAALKLGMNYILVQYPDCIGVVTADADGQHDVGDILRVASELNANPTALVLGSRDFSKKIPFRSKLGNIISRYVYRLLIGLNLSDTQTGLRGTPRRLMKLCLAIRANRYEFETEQLVLTKNEGIALREVPIQTIYFDKNQLSHFKPLYDSLRIYFVLLRYGISSAAAATTDIAMFWLVFALSNSLLVSNMSARLISLWVQLALLQSFVFKKPVNGRILIEYIGLVILSGLISTALQTQVAQILAVPIAAKILADTIVFIFNFLFIRDLIFGKWTDSAVDD
jgi:glycosyltransferase involved in cell wall biosynthesis